MQPMISSVSLLLAAATTAMLQSDTGAQSPLTTTWSWNNHDAQALYFTLDASVPIDITGLDIGSYSYAGTTKSVQFYMTIPGITTHSGSETNPANWVLVGGGTLTSNGHGYPAPVSLNAPITLLTAPVGFAIVSPGHGFSYTNGTATYSTSEVTLQTGTGTSGAFSGQFYSPRIVNTNIYYIINSGLITTASATSYGVGCGSPALALTPLTVPVIGTTGSASITNVPASLVATAMGWSDTFAFPVSLPHELTSLGMPGCYLLQSSQVVGLGATTITPGTHQFDFAVPLLNSLVGAHVYLQAYAYAPAANPLQVVVSNGIDWQIGNQ